MLRIRMLISVIECTFAMCFVPHRARGVENDDHAVSLAASDGSQLTIQQRGLFQASQPHTVPLRRLPFLC
jgi:hypothetical protein